MIFPTALAGGLPLSLSDSKFPQNILADLNNTVLKNNFILCQNQSLTKIQTKLKIQPPKTK